MSVNNYTTVEQNLKNYTKEVLNNENGPLELLKKLNDVQPTMINNAKNLNLLSAALVYLYLKRNNLNGRGGITAKSVAEHFSVKAANISQKTFDIDTTLYGLEDYTNETESYEFIDKDRFRVNDLYWNFLESPEADDTKKAIKILKEIIQEDPNYFDPYITLAEYYAFDAQESKAVTTLADGFNKAMRLVMKKGKFPDRLPWGFIENRHIIRILFHNGMLLWENNQKEQALAIFMQLLQSNPGDNIGARYSIAAILDGFNSQEEYEEKFAGSLGLDFMKTEEWFEKVANKHRDIFGWWLDLSEEEMYS